MVLHKQKWDTEDFDKMSWHDVHVHGFRILEIDGENGTAELIFDIDYILEWIDTKEGFSFVVAQACLQFHKVFGLRFTLDYVSPSAGMCAFSIAGIERESVNYATGYTSYRWKMDINWPTGQIEFESPSFTQHINGSPCTQPNQSLSGRRLG